MNDVRLLDLGNIYLPLNSAGRLGTLAPWRRGWFHHFRKILNQTIHVSATK